MALIRRIKAPHGARIRVKKGQSLNAPKKSIITITTAGGKRKMPGARKRKMVKKKVKKKRKPSYPLLGVAKGQKAGLRIGESELVVTRTPDIVRLKRMPKRQRLIRE